MVEPDSISDKLLGWWRNLRGYKGRWGSYEVIAPMPDPPIFFLDRLSSQLKLVFVTHFLIAMVQIAHSEVFFQLIYAYPRKNLII